MVNGTLMARCQVISTVLVSRSYGRFVVRVVQRSFRCNRKSIAFCVVLAVGLTVMRNPPTPPSAGPVFRTKRPSRVRPRSLLRHVVLLLGISLILVIGVGALLWLGLGRPNLSLPSPASTPITTPSGAPPQSGLTVADRLNSLKVVLAVVGGIGAIVALTLDFRTFAGGGWQMR
jgi:hypothetical protein